MHRYTVCAFNASGNSIDDIARLLKKEFLDLCVEEKKCNEKRSIFVDLNCVDNAFDVITFLNKHYIIGDNELCEMQLSMPDYLEFF